MIDISFIVPVYKVEQYLDDCVKSILGQTGCTYEIILVDDGSPDDCPRLCDEYAKSNPIITAVHKQNGGLSSARNAGLRVAQGEYVMFVDSDDMLLKDAGRILLDKARQFDAQIVHAGYASGAEKQIKYHVKQTWDTDKMLTHEILCGYVNTMIHDGSMVFCWRNLFKRSFLQENNLIFNESLLYAEDAPFDMEAVLRAQSAAAVNEYVYYYRHRPDSIVRAKYKKAFTENLNKQWLEKCRIYDELCDIKSDRFYKDTAEYNLKALLPQFIENILINDVEKPFAMYKAIFKTPMIKRSFKDYNIKSMRSKSLDYFAVVFAKNKLYLLSYLVSRKMLRISGKMK